MTSKEYMCLWWAQVPAELRKLREEEKLCDLTFVLNGSLEYKMHSLVLVCASSQFRSRLNKTSWQNTYFFDNVNVECFRHLLNYVYGCNLVLNEGNVKDMLYLATMLSIDTAIVHCEEFCNILPNHSQTSERSNVEDVPLARKLSDQVSKVLSVEKVMTIAPHSGVSASDPNKVTQDDITCENAIEALEQLQAEGTEKNPADDNLAFQSSDKEVCHRRVKSEGGESHDGNSNSSSKSAEDADRRTSESGDKFHEKPKGKSLEDICAQLASSRQGTQGPLDVRINTPQKSPIQSKSSPREHTKPEKMEKDTSIYDFDDVVPFSSSATCLSSALHSLPSCSGGIFSNACGGKGKYSMAPSPHIDLRACAIRREKDKSKYISTLLGLRSQDNESPHDMEASQSPALDAQTPLSVSPTPVSTSTLTTVSKTAASLSIRIPKPNFSSGSNGTPVVPSVEPPISWSPIPPSPAETPQTWPPSERAQLPLTKDLEISKIVESLETMTDTDPQDSDDKSESNACNDAQLMDTDSNISTTQSEAVSSVDNLTVPSSTESAPNQSIVPVTDQNKPNQNEVVCTSATSTPGINTAQSLYPFLNQIGQNLVPVYLPLPNMPNFNGTKDDFSSLLPTSLTGIAGGMPPLQNIVKSVNDSLPLPQTLQHINGTLTQAALQQSQSVAALQQSHSFGDIGAQLNFPQFGNLHQNLPNMSFTNNHSDSNGHPDAVQQSSTALPVMANSQTQTSNSSSASEEDEDEQTPMETTSAVADSNLQQQLQSVLSQQLAQPNMKNLGASMENLNNLNSFNMGNINVNSLQAAANLNAAMSLYTCMMLPNAAGVPQPTVLLPQPEGLNSMMQQISTNFTQPTVTSSSAPFLSQPQNGITYPTTSVNGQSNQQSFVQPNANQSQNVNTQLQLPCSIPSSTPSMLQSSPSPMLTPISQPSSVPILQPGLMPTNIQNTALMAQATLTHTNITPSPLPNGSALNANQFPQQTNNQALVPHQQGMNATSDIALLPQNSNPISGNPLIPPSINQLNNASFIPAGTSQPFLPPEFNFSNPLMAGKGNLTKSGFPMGSPFLGTGNFPLASTLQQMGQSGYDLSSLCKEMPTMDDGPTRTNGQVQGAGAADGIPVAPGMPPVTKHLFDCPVCGKGFPNTKQRAVHMRIHSRTEHKPFVCDMCGFRTKYADRLKIHKRLQHTHKGVKPFKCPYCPYATSLKGNCRKHVMTKHPGLEVTVEQVMPI